MDDEVVAMFSPSVSADANDAPKGSSSSVFRSEVKVEMEYTKDVPPLALASTNSSEWSKVDEEESVIKPEDDSTTASSLRSVFLLLTVATIAYVIATNAANGTKLFKTAIQQPNVINNYSSFEHQESDVERAVTEFEEYCNKGANEVFFHLLFQFTHMVQSLTNLNIWREKAEGLLSGALPMNWAGW